MRIEVFDIKKMGFNLSTRVIISGHYNKYIKILGSELFLDLLLYLSFIRNRKSTKQLDV